jgi:translin
MDNLEQITEKIRQDFDTQTAARDQALTQARILTRHCSLAIRAVHREEIELMNSNLEAAGKLAASLTSDLDRFPNLYHAGYTQDALKEYAEAQITCALILDKPLPSPDDIQVIPGTYLKGLSEVRRRCLDILRHGYSDDAERLLRLMDEIFAVLVTMDYPDAITNGLRRQTDVARSIIERTRGDLTFSLRGETLTRAITSLSQQLQGEGLSKEDFTLPGYPTEEENNSDD